MNCTRQEARKRIIVKGQLSVGPIIEGMEDNK